MRYYNLVLVLILAGCPGSDSHPVTLDSGPLDSGASQNVAGSGTAGRGAARDASVEEDSGPAGSGGVNAAGSAGALQAAGRGGAVEAGHGGAGVGGFGGGGVVAAGQGGGGSGGSAGSAAGSGAGSSAGSGGAAGTPSMIPDQDTGVLDNAMWPMSEAFAYACYTRDTSQDAAICRAGYGIGPAPYQFDDAKIVTAKESCAADGGIVLTHTCPTNSMLQGCFESTRSPAYAYTCYYFGDESQSMPGLSLESSPDLVYLNPDFTGR